MKVIISPAKSIDTSNLIGLPELSVASFIKESNQLIGKLKKMSVKKLETMMHISKDLAELNHQRFNNWTEPLELSGDVAPSILAFNGEVYKGFDARSLTMEELAIAQNKIRILCGLYGILKPFDLLYPYRLEMGTKWEITPKQKNLYQFWGSKLSVFLNQEMEKDEVLVNLASTEYAKAIDRKTLKARVITPVFKEFKNGEYKIVMMYAKHARGAMARYIVKHNIEDPDQLKLYDVDGYQFDVNQSSENEWVFIRS
jgi:cytoplasmic iron level regulating protein YaaA (DUF328/UPF0246 family)